MKPAPDLRSPVRAYTALARPRQIFAAQDQRTCPAPRTRPAYRTCAALLALSLAAAPSRAAAQPPTSAATPAELARQAYAQRDFLRAARLYEALFANTRAAKFLYNAGMAREAAGHDAQALLHWREYLRLAGDIAADERAQLLQQMAAARRRTAPIDLTVASPRAEAVELTYTDDAARDPLRITVQGRQDLDLEPGPWTVRVVGSSAPPHAFVAGVAADARPQRIEVRPDQPAPPASRPVTVRFGPKEAVAGGITVSLSGPHPVPDTSLRSAEHTWKLAPDVWVLHARAPGYLATDRVLGPPLPPAVDVELRRDWTRPLNIGLGVGLAIAGAGLLGAGTTLAARGAGDYRSIHAALPADRPLIQTEADAVLASIQMQTTGYALLGAGAGAGVVAITSAVGGSRKALVAEASVGAALLLTGAIGLPLTIASYAKVDANDVTLTDADTRRVRDHLFGASLGAGLALTGFALLSLLARAVLIKRSARGQTRTMQPALQVSPTAGTLGLRGRF